VTFVEFLRLVAQHFLVRRQADRVSAGLECRITFDGVEISALEAGVEDPVQKQSLGHAFLYYWMETQGMRGGLMKGEMVAESSARPVE
jgi:hypothetical protein